MPILIDIARMRSLYEILSISPKANMAEIRVAYRAKVKEVHPDTGGSNEAFSEVVLAYEILSDDDRRRQYDETGTLDDPGKAISSGAVLIVEGLINGFIQRQDAKYSDAVNLMCADISIALRSKIANIDVLEKRKHILADLKDRFRAKSSEENVLHDILDQKIEALGKALSAERLAIAQLNEASSILRRYDFVRESRKQERPAGYVDLSAFGRPVDPLLKTEELTSKKM
jgi:curved DNA-binding protein CbpA